jgi:hypothetical protein
VTKLVLFVAVVVLVWVVAVRTSIVVRYSTCVVTSKDRLSRKRHAPRAGRSTRTSSPISAATRSPCSSTLKPLASSWAYARHNRDVDMPAISRSSKSVVMLPPLVRAAIMIDPVNRAAAPVGQVVLDPCGDHALQVSRRRGAVHRKSLVRHGR